MSHAGRDSPEGTNTQQKQTSPNAFAQEDQTCALSMCVSVSPYTCVIRCVTSPSFAPLCLGPTAP